MKSNLAENVGTEAFESDAHEGQADASIIEATKVKLHEDPQVRPPRGKSSKLETPDVYDDTFVIGTVLTPKKHILASIRGRVQSKLGEDYYYGYVYQDGILSFIATQSVTHAEGKLSVFTQVLMEYGNYVFTRGPTIHHLTSSDKGVTEHRQYRLPDDAVSINDLDPLEKNQIPETLRLKWSLRKNRLSALLIVSAAFLVAACACVVTMQSYGSVLESIKSQPKAATPQAKTLRLTPDFGMILEKMAKTIDGKGTFQLSSKADKMQFVISFPNESDARNFLVMAGPGAIYEDKKVTVGFQLAGVAPQAQGSIPAAAPAPAPGPQAGPGPGHQVGASQPTYAKGDAQ